MSNYGDQLRHEAFGHTHFQVSRRDEDRLPIVFDDRKDGVYYLRGKWRVLFGGSYRFEEFGLEQYDNAGALLRHLQAGGNP